jgi:hypothetical protein
VELPFGRVTATHGRAASEALGAFDWVLPLEAAAASIARVLHDGLGWQGTSVAFRTQTKPSSRPVRVSWICGGEK